MAENIEQPATPAVEKPMPKAPAATPVNSEEAEQAAKFGRIDTDGNVWVRDGETERRIGQLATELPEEPLQLYVRRYLDLKASVDLLKTRMPHLNSKQIDQNLASLRQQLSEPAAIGDLPALRAQLEQLEAAGEKRKEELVIERAQAKEAAQEAREKVVARAEQISNQDPARTQWKNSGQQLRELLDEWKSLQRKGPRLERAVENELWKRFSAARTVFDRNRRAYFNKLDSDQAEAKAAKEKLIARAEELSKSNDWGATASAYRELMTQWKRAGHAARKVDDALWERFHAAQQVFFDARRAQNEATDAEYQANLKIKEELLEKAEALLPVKDVETTKAKLRPIQDAWDETGRVPRADMSRIEGRMRAVEDALRAAEDEKWRASNPETKARAAGMAGQLENLIAEIKGQIDEAEAAGDKDRVASLTEDLQARETWLAQVKSVTD
ncbi:MAG: DUF349 domain-containing protein [Varibaculum sp.]|nr:DUF349 domain-containing protein [Varibaculum sp.]